MKNIVTSALICLFLVVGIQNKVFSQEPSDTVSYRLPSMGVRLIARNYGDSIVLRWAPDSPIAWFKGNRSGYRVDRIFTIPGEEEDSVYFVPVRSEPFKPLSEAEMIARYQDEKHPYGMIASQFLYGEVDLSGEETGFGAMVRDKSEELQMRFGFTLQAADFDPDVADALGLRWVFYPGDSKDSVFEFRVVALGSTEDEPIYDGWRQIERNEVYNHNEIRPMGIYAQAEDHAANIYWVKDNKYTAYYVERSMDNVHFKRLNERPHLTSHMEREEIQDADVQLPIDTMQADVPPVAHAMELFEIYPDSLDNNTQIYYYRVIGIDAFGVESIPSDTIKVRGQEPSLLGSPENIMVVTDPRGGLKITWTHSSDTDGLIGYLVSALRVVDEATLLLTPDLLPATQQEFLFGDAVPGFSYMISVAAVDSNGAMRNSLPVFGYVSDTIPPAAPTGVRAVFDSIGTCLITWKDNEEPDIRGYKVYYRLNDRRPWIQLTSEAVENPYFLDFHSLNTLTKSYDYTIVAVDRSGNHSEYSDFVQATIPDTIPPSSAVIKQYHLYDDHLDVAFYTGIDDDVVKYILLRRSDGGNWEVLKEFTRDDVKKGELHTSDYTIERNIEYEYALQMQDISGLTSLSQILPVRLRGSKENVQVPLTIRWNASNKTMMLSWITPKIEGDYYYILYKKVNDEPWVEAYSYSKDMISAGDRDVRLGNTYSYKILVFRNGIQQGAGEVVKVTVPEK